VTIVVIYCKGLSGGKAFPNAMRKKTFELSSVFFFNGNLSISVKSNTNNFSSIIWCFCHSPLVAADIVHWREARLGI
jgi:hypothetical protein